MSRTTLLEAVLPIAVGVIEELARLVVDVLEVAALLVGIRPPVLPEEQPRDHPGEHES